MDKGINIRVIKPWHHYFINDFSALSLHLKQCSLFLWSTPVPTFSIDVVFILSILSSVLMDQDIIICVIQLWQHYFGCYLVICSAISHYLLQYCFILNWKQISMKYKSEYKALTNKKTTGFVDNLRHLLILYSQSQPGRVYWCVCDTRGRYQLLTRWIPMNHVFQALYA